jgi:hypothetical protein
MTEQINQDQWRAWCASAYFRLDDTGKSPWHFISTHAAFTAIVSRIDAGSVSSVSGGNHE